jgi:hypothetical protein
VADLESVGAYLEGKSSEGVALFRRCEELVERCGPSEPAPRSSVVYWSASFAGAFVERGRLELNIDLLRQVEHPCLLAAFDATKRVVTHGLRVTDAVELDDSIVALLAEAYEDVGPGTRGR